MRKVLFPAMVTGSALTLLVWSTPGMSQPKPVKPPVPTVKDDDEKPKADTVTRVYEVQDLLVIVKDYPLDGPMVPPTRSHQGGSGGGGGGSVGVPSGRQMPESSDLMEGLKALIQNNVDNTGWRDNGGETGSITSTQNQLLIVQTPENHTAIRAFLDELRKGRARMVRVRADWVFLAPGEIDKLMKNGANDVAAMPEIDRAAVRALPPSTVHYAGQITCFSGQTVHIASGRVRNVVNGLVPVVATDAVSAQPIVDLVQFGASLEINPTVSVDSATLDLNSVVSDAVELPTTPITTQPTLDRLGNVVQRFHTTVQMPVNKPVLIGGMTADPATGVPAGKELYLIIEADTGK